MIKAKESQGLFDYTCEQSHTFVNGKFMNNQHIHIDAVTLSGILKVKQKLGVTFNFDKQDVIDLTKFSKMTMCRASEANS